MAPSSGKSDTSHDVEFLGALSLTEYGGRYNFATKFSVSPCFYHDSSLSLMTNLIRSQDHAVKIEEMVKNLLQVGGRALLHP